MYLSMSLSPAWRNTMADRDTMANSETMADNLSKECGLSEMTEMIVIYDLGLERKSKGLQYENGR